MDIKIKTEEINFVYRVAAIIVHDNKLLVQKNNSFDYITLPGGKCSIGETSNEAIIREIKEEMGLETKFIKTRAIFENLFHSDFDNKKRHEILIINELSIISKINFNDNIIYNIENKYENDQYFEWIDIKEIDKYNLKPDFLMKVINSDELIHKIQNELKQ